MVLGQEIDMSMYHIATSIVSSPGAVSFSSIPQNFTHLQIRGQVRSPNASQISSLYIGFNNTIFSTTLYAYHIIAGTGTGMALYTNGGVGQWSLFGVASTNLNSNVYTDIVIDILDYSNTNKFKSAKGIMGFHDGVANVGMIETVSGLWANTAAINQISLTPDVNCSVGTRFDLYGISSSGAVSI